MQLNLLNSIPFLFFTQQLNLVYCCVECIQYKGTPPLITAIRLISSSTAYSICRFPESEDKEYTVPYVLCPHSPPRAESHRPRERYSFTGF